MPSRGVQRGVARSDWVLPGRFSDLVKQHPPRAIRDDVDYQNTMEVIDALTSLPKLTKGQREYLDTLAVLVGAYEREHHAIDTSDLTPVEMLQFLMEEHDMSASDLGRLLGNRTLGSKILRGDRELSKTHIGVLSKHFGVGPQVFLATAP